MTPEEWVEGALDYRESIGLPRHVEDPAILRQAAAILRPILAEQERRKQSTQAAAEPTTTPRRTGISWTDATWNVVTGCSHVSDGCARCYAETLSLRRGWSRHPWTANHAEENVVLHPERLRAPYTWRSPSRVFVASMGDVFHELVPDEFIAQVFAVMAELPRHRFQLLTKRSQRMAEWPGPWPENVWAGVSVEDQRVLHRVDDLRRVPAAVRFLSCEPLLGPLPDLDLAGIGWVIIGGESGLHLVERDHDGQLVHRDRWMDHAWARGIRDLCVAAGVPVWFKQSSGPRTEMGTALRELDGSRWAWRQMPDERPFAPPERVG